MYSADWCDTNCSLADEVNVFIIDDVIMIIAETAVYRFISNTGQRCCYIMDKRASILLFCFW